MLFQRKLEEILEKMEKIKKEQCLFGLEISHRSHTAHIA
jgi:hypothetical protein